MDDNVIVLPGSGDKTGAAIESSYRSLEIGQSFFYMMEEAESPDGVITGVSVLRVPGGWIHIINVRGSTTSTFVPLD